MCQISYSEEVTARKMCLLLWRRSFFQNVVVLKTSLRMREGALSFEKKLGSLYASNSWLTLSFFFSRLLFSGPLVWVLLSWLQKNGLVIRVVLSKQDLVCTFASLRNEFKNVFFCVFNFCKIRKVKLRFSYFKLWPSLKMIYWNKKFNFAFS